MSTASIRLNQLQNQINCEKKGAIICASIAAVAAIIAAVALALFLTVPIGAAITPFVAIATGGAALVLLITAVSLFVAKEFKYREWVQLQRVHDTIAIEVVPVKTLDIDHLTAAQVSTLKALDKKEADKILLMPKKAAKKILTLPKDAILQILQFSFENCVRLLNLKLVTISKLLKLDYNESSQLLASLDREQDINKFLNLPYRMTQEVFNLADAQKQRFYSFLINDCVNEDNVDWILHMLNSPLPDSTQPLSDYKKFLYLILNGDLKVANTLLQSVEARTYYADWFVNHGAS